MKKLLLLLLLPVTSFAQSFELVRPADFRYHVTVDSDTVTTRSLDYKAFQDAVYHKCENPDAVVTVHPLGIEVHGCPGPTVYIPYAVYEDLIRTVDWEHRQSVPDIHEIRIHVDHQADSLITWIEACNQMWNEGEEITCNEMAYVYAEGIKGDRTVIVRDSVDLEAFNNFFLTSIEDSTMAFSGSGSGTELDPYQVSTPTHLNEVRDDLTAYYLQVNDIDMTFDTQDPSGDFYNSGQGWSPIGTFPFWSGNFDGGGFTIDGLFSERTDFVGLFYRSDDGGVIKNVHISNGDLTSTDSSAGGIIGSAGSTGFIIENVSYQGAVTGAVKAGGIAGILESNSIIRKARSSGTVETTSTSGTDGAGGIAGRNAGTSQIENCYSSAQVSSPNVAGGIAGYVANSATRDKCYSTGQVIDSSGDSSASYIGGLVGRNNFGGSTTNSFWDTQASGVASSDGGTGKTTTEMQDIDTFTDTATTGLTTAWDMVLKANHDGDEATAIWFIDDGVDYPRLWFEFEGVAGATLEAQTGSYSIGGKTADLLYGRILESQTGSYSVSGKNADLLQGYRVQAETGSFSIDGKDADLLASRILSAETGSYAIDGKDASVLVGYVLPSETGNYLIDGKTADLIVTEVGSFTLSAEKGNYAINGKQASLIKDYILELQKGSYSVSGKDASLLKGFNLSTEKGDYVLTGKQVDLLKDYILSLAKGSYQIDGKEADFTIISVGDATQWSISANELYSISLSEEGLYTISLSEKELYIIDTSANEILD